MREDGVFERFTRSLRALERAGVLVRERTCGYGDLDLLEGGGGRGVGVFKVSKMVGMEMDWYGALVDASMA